MGVARSLWIPAQAGMTGAGDIYMDGQEGGGVLLAPYGPPARRGDGRRMLRPYGLARAYPG